MGIMTALVNWRAGFLFGAAQQQYQAALNANAPQRAQPRTFSLTAAELQQLNGTNRQVILDRPDLKYEPWVPRTQRRISSPRETLKRAVR